MDSIEQALYSFFSSFGVPAYEENSVPDNADLDYWTYELKEPEPGENCSLAARYWSDSTSFEKTIAMKAALKEKIKDGYAIPVGDGAIWIWPDNPFYQNQPSDEPKLKIGYFLLVLGGYKS